MPVLLGCYAYYCRQMGTKAHCNYSLPSQWVMAAFSESLAVPSSQLSPHISWGDPTHAVPSFLFFSSPSIFRSVPCLFFFPRSQKYGNGRHSFETLLNFFMPSKCSLIHNLTLVNAFGSYARTTLRKKQNILCYFVNIMTIQIDQLLYLKVDGVFTS